MHEVPGLTESSFLKTLLVAQPFLGGLARDGEEERPVGERCSLYFLT